MRHKLITSNVNLSRRNLAPVYTGICTQRFRRTRIFCIQVYVKPGTLELISRSHVGNKITLTLKLKGRKELR